MRGFDAVLIVLLSPMIGRDMDGSSAQPVR
jgi:hypothetical protein